MSLFYGGAAAYPFVIFRAGRGVFVLSSQVISSLEDVPSVVQRIPHSSAMFGICQSYGRLIATIDLNMFLSSETGGVNDAVAAPGMMILLRGTPVRAFLVDEIIGVEKTNRFTRLTKPPLTNRHIRHLYTYEMTNEVVMELDVSSILSHITF